MKITGIPGLPTDQQAGPKSKEAVLPGSDRSIPTGESDYLCGTSTAPSSGPEWLGPVLDRFSKMTPAGQEKIGLAIEADVTPAPAGQSLASRAASQQQAHQPGCSPQGSLCHLRTFNGDANLQASQVADYAAALRRDDTQVSTAFEEQMKKRLRDGEKVAWKLPEDRLVKLTESSKQLLQNAGIEVGPLDEEERSPHEMVHTKTLLVDLQSLRPASHPSMQAYYDAQQGTINFWSLSGAKGLPGAELLLPGAELFPIEPPQAPVTAFGGPFEWEWNLFPKPGCNESRS